LQHHLLIWRYFDLVIANRERRRAGNQGYGTVGDLVIF
jgi:hypothetical protein